MRRSKSFPNESETTDHAAELEDFLSSRSGIPRCIDRKIFSSYFVISTEFLFILYKELAKIFNFPILISHIFIFMKVKLYNNRVANDIPCLRISLQQSSRVLSKNIQRIKSSFAFIISKRFEINFSTLIIVKRPLTIS